MVRLVELSKLEYFISVGIIFKSEHLSWWFPSWVLKRDFAKRSGWVLNDTLKKTLPSDSDEQKLRMAGVFWNELRIRFKGLYSEFQKPLLLINYNQCFIVYHVFVCLCVCLLFHRISVYFNISFKSLSGGRDMLPLVKSVWYSIKAWPL